MIPDDRPSHLSLPENFANEAFAIVFAVNHLRSSIRGILEIARAGEAGRGFAVVAQEVRAPAQRAAEAAKKFKGLIVASTALVDDGVALVRASGTSLKQIVLRIGDVSTVVDHIAASAQQQAASLHEVSMAAEQMDKSTQENATMVEETTGAANSGSHEALSLAA